MAYKKTQVFQVPKKIEVRRVDEDRYGKAGRGVYATKKIKAGEVIEECPIIRCPEDSILPPISYYTFQWKPTYTKWGGEKKVAAMVLGYGSLYNHCSVPNADVQYKNDDCQLVVALDDIEPDEEVVIDYRSPYVFPEENEWELEQ